MKASVRGTFDGQAIIEYVVQLSSSNPKLTPGVSGEVAELMWIDPVKAKNFLIYRDQHEMFVRICVEVLGSVPII